MVTRSFRRIYNGFKCGELTWPSAVLFIVGIAIGGGYGWIADNLFGGHPPDVLTGFAIAISFFMCGFIGVDTIIRREDPVHWARGRLAVFYGTWVVVGFWGLGLVALCRALAALLGF